MKKALLFATAMAFCTFASAQTKDITLENGNVKAVFDSKGALVYMADKNSGWEIMSDRSLAKSFEMLLPLRGQEYTKDDCEYNLIEGTSQSAPAVETGEGWASFTWNGLTSSTMEGTADITLRCFVRLTDLGLEFSGKVDNNSKHNIDYISWPCLGEVTVTDKTRPLHHNTLQDTRELFPRFFNQHGYWGVDYPTSTYLFPDKTYLQVNDTEKGFVVFNRERPSHLVISSFELLPGFEIRSFNPTEDFIDGERVRIQFKMNTCVYTDPGCSSEIEPIEFITYKGDMFTGVKTVAAEFRDTKFRKTGKENVFKAPGTWIKAGASNPEALKALARTCLDKNIDAIILHGWNNGSLNTLSEAAGMAAAITECREMGVKIILETSFTRVDRHDGSYPGFFRSHVMTDPFDLPYNYDWLCPNSPEIAATAASRWRSLESMQVCDGFINNSALNTNKSYICFNRNHGHAYGQLTADGIGNIERTIAEEAGRAFGKCVITGSPSYGQEYADACWANIGNGYFNRLRILNPDFPMLRNVETRNARKQLNESLLYGFTPVLDLNFFDSDINHYPNIHEYASSIKQLRSAYPELLWTSSYSHQDGASVSGNDIEWTVFTAKDGKRAVVVVNNSRDRSSKVSVKIDGCTGAVIATPENIQAAPFNGTTELAPQSAAIIMEK